MYMYRGYRYYTHHFIASLVAKTFRPPTNNIIRHKIYFIQLKWKGLVDFIMMSGGCGLDFLDTKRLPPTSVHPLTCIVYEYTWATALLS